MDTKLYVSVWSSICGFHNPEKHHGLKDLEFLALYKEYLDKKPYGKFVQYKKLLLNDEYYFLTQIRLHLLNKKRVH
jgi:hypothetical protein